MQRPSPRPDLLSLLTKTATQRSDITGDWRRLERPEMAGQAEVLIAEISETVVPARLTFRNDRGEALDVLAGNRCLGRVDGSLPDRLSSFLDLAGRDLAGADDHMLGRICALFAAFDGGGVMSVRRQVPEPEASLITGGLSAARLFAEMERALRGEPVSGDLDGLSTLLMDRADHWVRFRCRVPIAYAPGREDAVGRCAALLEALAEEAGDQNCNVLRVIRARSNRAVVAARSGDESLVAQVPNDMTDSVAAAWRATNN